MISTFSRLAALCSFAVAASGALAQSSFTSPHMLESPDGTLLGIGWDMRWGHGMTYPTTVIPIKPVTKMLLSPYGNGGVFQWMAASMDDGTPVRAVMNTRRLGKSPGISNIVYSEMELAQIVLPACDVESKDPGGIEASFRSDGGTTSPLYDAKGLEVENALYQSKRQKMWLPANFRIKIGNLPCSRVSKIDAITVKQKVADLDGDGKEERYFDVEELSFVLPRADAPLFLESSRATQTGNPTDYQVTLEYLNEDGQILIRCSWVTNIISVTPEDPYGDPADPTAQARVTGKVHQKPPLFKFAWAGF